MPESGTTRRRFLAGTAGVTAGIALTSAASANAARFFLPARFGTGRGTGTGTGSRLQEDAAQLVSGKDTRLQVLQADPAVLQTPLELLRQDALTPVEMLFVRNNQQPRGMAHTRPVEAAGWKLDIDGLVNRSLQIDAKMLQDLPQTSFNMVLQCSGNGRSLFSRAAQTSGTQWDNGGFGCVQFGGVRLASLLEHLGIEPLPAARFVKAQGVDNPPAEKEDFLHSLPLEDVLNRSLIALELNGNPLPAIHGGPVRLITPGVYATMNIKWLSSLTLEADETDNYNHKVRYRVPKNVIRPGAEFEFGFDNSTFNWNMKVKTIVLAPQAGAELKAGPTLMDGVAFNDGQAAIETVLVSVDRGASWQRAELSPSDSRYAWTRFQARVDLAAGQRELWTRAVDTWGRSQPLDGSIAWNPRGYEWNGVEKIVVNVRGG